MPLSESESGVRGGVGDSLVETGPVEPEVSAREADRPEEGDLEMGGGGELEGEVGVLVE